MKTVLLLALLFCRPASAQRLVFADNFEQQRLDSCWQVVAGAWRIGDVSALRIAPAEGGYRSVLLSDGNAAAGQSFVRLFISLPDSLKGRKLLFRVAYYIKAAATAIRVDGEFYRSDKIDGLRGKPWSASLRRLPGRWGYFQKLLTIPADANQVRFVFYGLNNNMVCYDHVVLSVVNETSRSDKR